MTKILERGTTKTYEKVCPYCGCKYTYTTTDLKQINANELVVKCPDCELFNFIEEPKQESNKIKYTKTDTAGDVKSSERALVDGRYFRVMPIAKVVGIDENADPKLVIEDQKLTAGLAIEKRLADDSYYVVAFVRPINGTVTFEDVAFRTIDCLDVTNPLIIEEFKNCVEFARQTLYDLLENEEE